LNIYRDERVLVAFETNDDAGVFKLDDYRYLIHTVDFITPVCDDPYTFGRIAAINSMSDVFAMGGDPISALSILMYNCDIDESIIGEMMQGACDEFAKVKCSLVGGHTVDDNEVKLGFAITGIVENGRYYKNVGLRRNDLIIYTKPLGIGILSTAVKGELASAEDEKNVNDIMLLSNYEASKILRRYDVSALTDVTGFGLAGHAYEMASGSNIGMEIYVDRLKFIPKSIEYASMGIVPAGAYYNKQFLLGKYLYSNNKKDLEIMMFDPQTSGGLLIAVAENDAENLCRDLNDIGYTAEIIAKSFDIEDDTFLKFI
jgi:selenide,water dikinase